MEPPAARSASSASAPDPSSRRRRRERPRIAVEVGAALDLVGTVLRWIGLTFLVPAVVALVSGTPAWPWFAGAAATSGTGLVLFLLTERDRSRIGPREGFLTVALTWVTVPAFGALPFVLAGEAPLSHPLDALFESMSGFTATGATVVPHPEQLSSAAQLWRQLTHWLGGMGIIVLAIAILPRLRVGGRQLLTSELAGPVDIEKLGATFRQTARRLWTLYVVLTAVATLLLAGIGWLGLDPAMTPWQAFAHATSAVSLGGFSPKNDSAAAFAPISQWLLCAIMFIAGLNFLRLFRLFVQRRVAVVTRDDEVRLYATLLLIGSVLVLAELVADGVAGGEQAVRFATFQAVSTMTTTGFAVADYTTWGALATMTLLMLMFVGASAGSTGGSIKVVRHLLLFRIVKRDLAHAVHRDVVMPVRLNGAVVDERALRSALLFVLLYLATFALGALGLVIDGDRAASQHGAFDAIGAAAACIGNVGPAFGPAGPAGSYLGFSDLSKGILTALMWLGRVEIVPVIVLLTRSFWRG